MPSMIRVTCLSLLALAASTASAQQQVPELPAPSPKARVEQRVGLVDFAVDYSSPGVKGRKIWGALVPFDRPWRTGANAATKVTASRDFKFGGAAVPAGSYSLYTVPGKATWRVALNSDLAAQGNDGFDAKKDVASITVTPKAIKGRERLTYLFSATTDNGARLDMEWEKIGIYVPIEVDTKTMAMANIDKAAQDAWRPLANSARYLLESNGDMDRALSLADQSIAIKATWLNTWVRAQLLAKKNRVPDAIAAAEQAIQLGTGDQIFENFYKPDVTKAVGDWKKKKG
jgi:Protein of unknown function (DUF2911)